MKQPLPTLSRNTLLMALLLAVSLRLGAQIPAPVIHLNMDASTITNSGTAPATFTRSVSIPQTTAQVPVTVGGSNAIDFGTTTGNYYVQATAPTDALKNLSAFTITGWINTRSSTMGSGGNRIVSWINNGGDGVDLVYQNNGSLRIGIDAWPDFSPAVSSANKILANASAPASNWVFFAVTYRSTGQVQFYFGNNTTDATLDVTRTYLQGNTGTNIGKLAIGAFNDNTRNAQTYDRMFRGLIDNVKIHNIALDPGQIVSAQRGIENADTTPPSAPANLAAGAQTSTSVSLTWSASTDNVGVSGYDLYNGTTLLTSIGPLTSFQLTGLITGTTYTLSLKARDAAGNTSASSNVVIVTPLAAPTGVPLVWVRFDGDSPVSPNTLNEGSIGTSMQRTGPQLTNNAPQLIGNSQAVDMGNATTQTALESTGVFDQLKNLSSFTLTGWLNCRSNVAGSGGNRIISWINNGGDGVDLVYQSDGSLRVGIDEWPDFSPAVSSTGKVPTDNATSASNWVFFAVTYQSSGAVQFYFGNSVQNASLDVTRTYTKPGVTGANISNLAFGTFNKATRNAGTIDRAFRGLLDDLQIHGTVLSEQDIFSVQRYGSVTSIPPGQPGNLSVTLTGNTSVNLHWSASSSNPANPVQGYDILAGNTLIGSRGAGDLDFPVDFQVVGLTPATQYNNVVVRARNRTGELSAPSNAVQFTTGASTALEPIVRLALDEEANSPAINTGIVPLTFSSSSAVVSNNIPMIPGNVHSRDGGIGGAFVDQLRNMKAFTITGWLNPRSAGSLLSWQRPGGEGVNLRVDAEGRLALHVNQDRSLDTPAKSSSQIGFIESTPNYNWSFFAVTYESSGTVRFYFGTNSGDATLNTIATLPSGETGFNILELTVGYCMIDAPKAGIYPGDLFNGLIDDVHVFASSLNSADIVSVQRRGNLDSEKPTPPSNIRVLAETSTSATISWTAATDNVGVSGYEILGAYSNTLRDETGPVTSYTITGLKPSTTYDLKIVAIDNSLNRSDPAMFKVTTSSGVLPQIMLHFDEPDNVYPATTGTLTANFVRSSTIPYSTTNARRYGAFDFDVNPGDHYVESSAPIDGLKSLNAFTITGWINNRSSIAGAGGNRIVSWINNGGDGVDLVYQNNGSLRLGVDGWPDFSPAVSSINKIPTDFSMSTPNWTFFAVTYTSAGEVKFYFGKMLADATLDVTRSYPAPGVTGTNIGRLAIGNFNSATRNSATWDRMFRGVIDEIQIFSTALSLADILSVQNGPQSGIGRMAMAQLQEKPPSQAQAEVESAIAQNYPNPYNEATSLQIALPHSVNVARLTLHDVTGRAMRSDVLTDRGEFSVVVSRSGLHAGVYIYTLIADGKVVGTRRMIVVD